MSGHRQVGNARRKRTCWEVITAGFRCLKESHGEDEGLFHCVSEGRTGACEQCDREVDISSIYRRLKK